jgi:putative two-component system response regulator
MARILVVDDEEPIREILSRRLQQWGHDVAVAGTAEDALEQMRQAPAEIVLCDVIMPLHDGVWLFGKVLEQWPETIFVAVSGAQDMNTVMRMRQLGAVDFVPKPIGREMLHQALDRALATLASRKPR